MVEKQQDLKKDVRTSTNPTCIGGAKEFPALDYTPQ